MRKVELELEEETAALLSDDVRRRAVARLVERFLRPVGGDPVLALLEKMAARAQASGLTDADIDAELAAYNAERRG